MMNSKMISIHQPDFFPWPGFFNKYLKSDIFVVLDDVHLSIGKNDWTNRTLVNFYGEKKWLTMPVAKKNRGLKTLKELNYLDCKMSAQRILNQCKEYYRDRPHYKEVFEFMKHCQNVESENLIEYNMNIIMNLIEYLKLPLIPIIFSSQLGSKKQGSLRIVEIIQILKSTDYLSGSGGKNYLRENLFKENGINLHYNNFFQNFYPQKHLSSFMGGLSIIDLMMELGPDNASDYLLSSRC